MLNNIKKINMETEIKYSKNIFTLSDRHTSVDVELTKQQEFSFVSFTSFDTEYKLCINNGELMQLKKIIDTIKEQL
tara:strand:+ start:180 stop:407 length:228 start_codon:yes stop_codon:yes gene_type:complete